jgi:hypothetical protein
MSIKQTIFAGAGKLFINAIKSDPVLQDEFLAFVIEKIPAISETATVEELRTAIAETVQAAEAVVALIQPLPGVEDKVV